MSLFMQRCEEGWVSPCFLLSPRLFLLQLARREKNLDKNLCGETKWNSKLAHFPFFPSFFGEVGRVFTFFQASTEGSAFIFVLSPPKNIPPPTLPSPTKKRLLAWAACTKETGGGGRGKEQGRDWHSDSDEKCYPKKTSEERGNSRKKIETDKWNRKREEKGEENLRHCSLEKKEGRIRCFWNIISSSPPPSLILFSGKREKIIYGKPWRSISFGDLRTSSSLGGGRRRDDSDSSSPLFLFLHLSEL